MLILVLGNHCTATNRVATALHEMGADTGELTTDPTNPVGYHQHPEARALHESLVNWLKPGPAPGDGRKPFENVQEAYGTFVKSQEDAHPVWVLSDPRILFFIEDVLSVARIRKLKTRVVAVHADPEVVADRLLVRDKQAGGGGLSPRDARHIAEAHQQALLEWLGSTRRKVVELDEVNGLSLHEIADYAGLELTDRAVAEATFPEGLW